MAPFYLDEDVSLHLVPELQARGHDVLAAKRYTRQGMPDHEQLATAVRLGRVLVISNRLDFLLLHRAWRDWFREWGPASPPRHLGILCIPQPPALPVGPAADLLSAFVVSWNVAPERFSNLYFRWTTAGGWEQLD